MGLDMWAFKVKKGVIDRDVDFQVPENTKSHKEICYWRKHYELHDWMGSLYNEKGGTSESFNCDCVRLTEEDLDKLKEEFMDFEQVMDDRDEKNYYLNFIKKAKNAIKKDYDVYYTSWW